jgi:bifunctional DNA-binding transcriptional regulator/antitoxin component of YhaV-PrlF toxin-antitoxin module
MDYNKSIKALRGAESLLLIFPKEVANRLNIENQTLVKYEVRNNELVIKKIKDEKRSLKANDMKEEEEVGITLPSYSKDIPFRTVLQYSQVNNTLQDR